MMEIKKSKQLQDTKILKKIAIEYGVGISEVEKDMQEALDATWDSTNPTEKEKQRSLFPKGKPTLDELIQVLAKNIF